jgi:hypothetical protein
LKLLEKVSILSVDKRRLELIFRSDELEDIFDDKE